MADKQIGKVIHYYDKLLVAIVKLNDDLKIGDEIKIVKGDSEFTQKVESMQMEHEPVSEAKKGSEVGMKVSQETKNGAKVYLV